MAHSFGNTGRIAMGGSWRRIVVVLAMALITACSPIYRNHGYVPTDEELALVEVGTDTRETVATIIGRPSASGLLNDVGWYYVRSNWKHNGAYAPQEENRQVVAITFTEDGVVENIERFGLEKGRIVPLSRRVTETNIKSQGLLRQLFGNIGGLSTDKLIQ
ncbi:MAG: SmpA/OmlA protein [Rhodobacteraceae bacterium]|uniref:outer membrane protein assembly factor BamE n=1 Tax=Cypionkella sp. TaxID=2811411 RepID=UPI0013232FFF|nr:outer membrane protein assembly factor BamE [Cypionkella sp.]KAF0170890.1 MAG: SmpA/OmlA protein [Paracoccaceae bacterium]MDO8328214.1 outer membrane protein assembly factor BamE [Cypionkella sp.]